uniref:Uncharacterized protein n=1 Tax=Rhizophora mucronata TaxID=61149 RepID=A0A2P2Q6P5_RHIMU
MVIKTWLFVGVRYRSKHM